MLYSPRLPTDAGGRDTTWLQQTRINEHDEACDLTRMIFMFLLGCCPSP
jgi:hypothetical protein